MSKRYPEYCIQCTLDLFCEPYSNFDRMIKLPQGAGHTVLCDGCGSIRVNDGWCIGGGYTDDCEQNHRHWASMPEYKRVCDQARKYRAQRRGWFRWYYWVHDRIFGSWGSPGLIHDLRHWWFTRSGDVGIPFEWEITESGKDAATGIAPAAQNNKSTGTPGVAGETDRGQIQSGGG